MSGAGEGEVVSKEVGEEERGARGGVDRRSDNATSVDVEIDPHRRRLGRSQTDFALQAAVECRAGESEMNRNNAARAPSFMCIVLSLTSSHFQLAHMQIGMSCFVIRVSSWSTNYSRTKGVIGI